MGINSSISEEVALFTIEIIFNKLANYTNICSLTVIHGLILVWSHFNLTIGTISTIQYGPML